MHVATALRATYIFSALTLMVSQANTTLFAWHPIFMTAGFLAFMVEGVLTALDFRAREGTPRVRAIQKHATLQMAASACILLGFTAIVANKVPWTRPLAMRGACLTRQLLMVQCGASAMPLIVQCALHRNGLQELWSAQVIAWPCSCSWRHAVTADWDCCRLGWLTCYHGHAAS